MDVKTTFRSRGFANRCPKTKDTVERLISLVFTGSHVVPLTLDRVGEEPDFKEHLSRKDFMVWKHIMSKKHDTSSLNFEMLHCLNKGRKMEKIERRKDMENAN